MVALPRLTIPEPAQAIPLSLPAILPEPPAPLDSFFDLRLQIANDMKRLIQPLNSAVSSVSDLLNRLESWISQLKPTAPLLQASAMTAVHVTPVDPAPEVHLPIFTLESASTPGPSSASGTHRHVLHGSDATS